MSLAGLRDISVIETPPAGRRPIRTHVGEYDEELVRLALTREVERGGESFFLHNRVETIDEAAEKLRQLCPELRFLVVHGQLPERELEQRMLSFLADHTELGAGFAIAMRDLEIRGAGDLLGAEQSGHVAAVGFELYVELLGEAVAELSGARRAVARPVRVDAHIDAYVPSSYIPSEAQKIDLHRRLALAESEEELRELRVAAEDRYGPLPDPVENLFAIQESKLLLARLGADYLVFRGGKATVGPLVLGSDELRELRRRAATAVYSSSQREVSLRGDGFEGALHLLAAIVDLRRAA